VIGVPPVYGKSQLITTLVPEVTVRGAYGVPGTVAAMIPKAAELGLYPIALWD